MSYDNNFKIIRLVQELEALIERMKEKVVENYGNKYINPNKFII
jgi:hypothetical protein